MIGLSSQEAQRRLYAQLSGVINGGITVKWMEEAKKNPCGILSNALIATAGLFLVVEFSLTPEKRGAWHILFQALILLFLAAFNISLLGWEAYMLRTQKSRHLLGRLGGALETTYPWTPSDYPKTAISTLRGPLTITAYRDGSLVNVPISLLVHGDIIELEPGLASPARAVLCSEEPVAADSSKVDVGQELPEELFRTSENGDSASYSFLQGVKSVKLMVEEAPILAHLKLAMQRKSQPSFLSREVKLMICIATIVGTSFYVVALLFNVFRYFLLKDDFDNSWPEMFLGIPVYTILPMLLLYLPLVWSLINLFGTARIVLLVDRGPLYFSQKSWRQRFKGFLQTLRVMAELICWCSHHPDIRMFHVLGMLTSVCAVDKEYLMTGEFPTPEKIFFFRTEDVPMEATDQHLNVVDKDKINEEILAGIQVSVTSPSDTHLTVADTANIKFHVGASGEAEEEGSSQPDALQVVTRFDSMSAGSVVSDVTPFELVMEVLDVSPDPNSYSGLAFDDVNWLSNINSLKPIGVNLLATSHLQNPSFSFLPVNSYSELHQHLHKCCCSCSLGVEIGVTEFFCNKFKKQLLLSSVSCPGKEDAKKATSRRQTPTFMTTNSSHLPPYIVSTVITSDETEKMLIMSRGNGNMVAHCCSDFWDGKDLQSLTETEKQTIVNYYNSRNLSSYCVALSFNPMVDFQASRLPKDEVEIFVPSSDMEKIPSNHSVLSIQDNYPDRPLTAEQLFKNLQCNQVFLGLVSLQYRPKQDIVSLIEDLYASGIRFVHFTAENELRAKIFAQKLGLEVDWNCFISLAQPSATEEKVYNKGLPPNEEESCDDGDPNDSSMASSMLSIYQATISHIRARLPKGIENIRPHIEQVDNVPLLVSLFTECSSETITEMLAIMQENSEVILCIGNAWNHENIDIFSQADVGVSLIPQHVDFPTCAITATCALSTSNSSQTNSHMNASSNSSKPFPGPLEVASYINSTPCQLCFGRDNDVSLLSLVCESRRLLGAIRLSLIFGVGASFSLSVLMVLSSIFFLPPPLSGSHLFWMLTVSIPFIMLSFLAIPLDQKIKSQMPMKRKSTFPDLWPVVLEFILFGFTGFYCLVLFSLTLWRICVRDITNSTCHFLLGNRDFNSTSDWNGWRGDSEQGLLFAQDFVAFFVTIYFAVLSVRYIHRTRPLWQLWKFVSWQYIVAVSGAVTLQLIYFVLSQSIAGSQLDIISDLSSVPPWVWCLGLAWPFIVLLLTELFKCIDKRKFKKAQTLLFLQFGTKLGMHSPI